MIKHTISFGKSNNIWILAFIIFSFACSESSNDKKVIEPEIEEPVASVKPSFDKVARVLFETPQEDYVMVLTHRGGFVDTPENSLGAIQNSIDLGVDIVELDVQKTKDDFLVIMHDTTIDRTTDGSGNVSDYTLDELKQFKLLMPNGAISEEFVPSLNEVLIFSKGKMHLFIDKGDDYLNLIYDDLLETNTIDQTIIGGTLSWFAYNSRFAEIGDQINYIPRAGTGQSVEYIMDFENGISPVAYFPSCDLIASNNETFTTIKNLNRWMFSTTLKGSNCSEETFVPETIWDYMIEQDIDGIFTDKPKELIDYLNSRNLHNNELN